MSRDGGSDSARRVASDPEQSAETNEVRELTSSGPPKTQAGAHDEPTATTNGGATVEPNVSTPAVVTPEPVAVPEVATTTPATKPIEPAPDPKESIVPKPMPITATTKPLVTPVQVRAPRVTIPPAPLAGKGIKPLSGRAVVSRPPPVSTLRGWSLEVAGHTGAIGGLQFSPDGRFVASGGLHDDNVRIWRIDQVAGSPTLTLDRVLRGKRGKSKALLCPQMVSRSQHSRI